jgi:predicted DNA-binding WGR domain protein
MSEWILVTLEFWQEGPFYVCKKDNIVMTIRNASESSATFRGLYTLGPHEAVTLTDGPSFLNPNTDAMTVSHSGEPEMRKFECREGAYKFWKIWAPKKIDIFWGVQYQYGRIGTTGKVQTKVFASHKLARTYYDMKIHEKLYKKNYTEKFDEAFDPGAIVDAEIPAEISAPFSVEKSCKHVTLKRRGAKWKCSDCGDVIELDKTVAEVAPLEVEAKAKRFINLNWRSA